MAGIGTGHDDTIFGWAITAVGVLLTAGLKIARDTFKRHRDCIEATESDLKDVKDELHKRIGRHEKAQSSFETKVAESYVAKDDFVRAIAKLEKVVTSGHSELRKDIRSMSGRGERDA